MKFLSEAIELRKTRKNTPKNDFIIRGAGVIFLRRTISGGISERFRGISEKRDGCIYTDLTKFLQLMPIGEIFPALLSAKFAHLREVGPEMACLCGYTYAALSFRRQRGTKCRIAV
jgi:hypothetical protein